MLEVGAIQETCSHWLVVETLGHTVPYPTGQALIRGTGGQSYEQQVLLGERHHSLPQTFPGGGAVLRGVCPFAGV